MPTARTIPLAPSSSGIWSRLGRVLRLEGAVFAELRETPKSWGQSLSVVLAVALAHGIGAVLRAPSQGGSEAPLMTFLFGFQGEILLWLFMSGALWLSGRWLFSRSLSWGSVARPLGFAFAPGAGVLIAGALSGLGADVTVPILAVLGVWRVAASYQAVRQALQLPRAAAAGILLLGLAVGVGFMAAGTMLLNTLSR